MSLFFIKTDSSANTCTIAGNGKNLNGSANVVLSTQYQSIRPVYDSTSTAWWY
jgi:hypothetical protein